jgi:pimeloyl-ACP methyl ester carboxylesterase
LTRRLIAAVAAASLTVAGLAGCTIGSQEAGSSSATPVPGDDAALAAYYDQPVDWQPCGAPAVCATINVPLDYRKPEGKQIELSLLKMPATGQSQGSLLVNPGGPGVSGKDYARNADAYFTDAVTSTYDIVGWDPRGVGDSTAVSCIDDAQLDTLIAADGTPDNPQEVNRLRSLARGFVAGCVKESGGLLAHLGTADSAQDMDVIRAVLGEDQLDYFGASYGTLLGATYADQFPDRVGRFVLDGAVDPKIDSEELGRLQAVGFETAFDAFVQDCLKRTGCPVGPTLAEARQQVTSLLQQADANPLPTGTSRALTESLATTGIFSALYSQQYGWPALRVGLQQALNGDGSVLLKLADIYTERNQDGTFASNINEAFPAISCADEPTDQSLARIARDSVTWQRSAPLFGESFAWGQYTCSIWPLPAKQPHALHAKGSAPILVIGTTRDPATPYEWAVSLAKQLDDAVLVTRDGDGHTGYNSGNACVDQTVDRYLVDGDVPSSNVTC